MSSLARTCLPLALACSAATATPPVPKAATAGGPPTIEVESGVLTGVAGDDPSVVVFKGVPYAAPPVVELRLRPPAPARAWTGVRNASAFSNSCMQELRRSLLPWTEEYMLRNLVNEDCLALNIWAPTAAFDNERARLPVYVFIHGGAFSSGSGEVLLYDGEGLAKKGIIVVTVNYRLGVFGFFCHPQLSAESAQHSCGNYGLLDQLSALGWVKRNIAAFGGDPEQVTLGGQSAGAASVHYLTASPLSAGLFQRAIAQSGPFDRRTRSPVRAEAEASGVEFAGALGLPELRALPAAALLAKHAESGVRFRPVIDGWVVPDQVGALGARGGLSDVPLLTGLTADERSSQKDYGKLTLSQWTDAVHAEYGELAAALLSRYPATSDGEAAERQKQLLRDAGLATLQDCRQTRARHGLSKDFGYLFERAIPWPEHPEYQAFHSGELPYVFDNLSKLDRPWQDVDRALATRMSSYWVNFISTGNPNGPGLPDWPSSSEQILRLGAETSASPTLAPETAQLFAQRLTASP
jgi:para-nitrobenzyl esterase